MDRAQWPLRPRRRTTAPSCGGPRPTRSSCRSTPPTFSGAVVLHVGRDAIGETGRVRQLGVERSLVAGEKLYTHSGFGLVSTNLADSGARANVSWT